MAPVKIFKPAYDSTPLKTLICAQLCVSVACAHAVSDDSGEPRASEARASFSGGLADTNVQFVGTAGRQPHARRARLIVVCHSLTLFQFVHCTMITL